MKFRTHQQIEESPVDYLVPLMDVLFILITFFVIAFSMSRMETEVAVKVPTSESSKTPLRDVGQVVVNVRKDGKIIINQVLKSEEELFSQFSQIALVNTKQSIVVRGDKETSYDNIFRVLDICRKAGLYHVSFASSQASTDATP